MENKEAEQYFTKSQKFYLIIKRLIDIFGSFIGISLLIIPMFIIVIIIKCSSKGPIFFIQERIGRNELVFKLIKFRSMRADAPEIPPSEMSEEQQRKLQYKFGNFLRKTSLDEIPQLFNIFIGQMSFIGPRPGAAHGEEELHVLRKNQRPNVYLVKPGLSGLAQIKMHREHDPIKKAEFDSQYIRTLSLWNDIKYFFLTFFKGGGGSLTECSHPSSIDLTTLFCCLIGVY